MKKTKVLKISVLILVIILILAIIIYLMPVMKNLTNKEGQVAFKEMVEETGFLGMLALFGLQVVQVLLIIIPGEPLEVLAGMCYGGIGGLIFITISNLILTSIILMLVRKFGRKFVYEFYNKKRVDKIEKSKIFQNPKKVEILMCFLFLLPGTPKDLLVYIAGLLPIKPVRFIIMSSLLRFPSVITSTYAGANLILGNWKNTLLIYAITLAIVGIIGLIINKIDKGKTKKIVKILQ